MFRFDYDATRYGRAVATGPKPPEQAALRGADKPTLWWWSFLFLVSAGNLVLWVVIARDVHALSDGYVGQQLLLLAEVCFAGQCALLISKLSALIGSPSYSGWHSAWD
jgi:hypothetical protein